MKQVIQNFEDELVLKKNQLQEERDKNIELGAELLTLVNRKEVLQSEFDALTAKVPFFLSSFNDSKLITEQL